MAKRFTLESRIRLETMLKFPNRGLLVEESDAKRINRIGKALCLNASSIWREVKNKGFTYDNYDAHLAHSKSLKTISAGNTHYRYSNVQQELILSLFEIYSRINSWSPNAILLRLRQELPCDIKLPSLETLYKWIYDDSAAGGSIYKHLPRAHKKRKQKVNNQEQKVSNKTSIHLRESIVDERSRVGDIEIDSVVGPANKPGILTATERKSRFSMAKLVSSKTGDETFRKLLELLLHHKRRIKTITSDNGVEFAKHAELAAALNTKYYFADPYSSYQRGSNENINGLIRRHFPKGTDFANITDKELQIALYKINHLPRKIHNGKTAHEVYYGISKKLIPKKQRNIIVNAFRT